MKTPWFGKQKILSLTILLAACGSGGSGDSGSPQAAAPVAGTEVTVTGSIKSVSGSQSEMKDWVIAMIDYDNSISSVATINAAGNFSLPHVLNSQRYTLALLDPQYKLAAVLTAAGDSPKTVKQVFKIGGTQLPILVHNGPVINFTNFEGIAFDKAVAVDSDGDLIPDGRETALADTSVDTDTDGVPNSIDSDIDGDGVINVLDLDDDGDSLPDAFDPDANGDGVLDINQMTGDLYFSSLLAYGSVQVIQDTLSDGSFENSLLITNKISGAVPVTLKVRSSSQLFEGALATRINAETGDPINTPFDNTLLDDGLNEDGAASDGTYVRRIKLAAGKLPKAQQVLFYQFWDTVGTDKTPRVRELPFMFPDVLTAAISGTYEPTTKIVTLHGTPYDKIKTFKWTVDIYNSAGEKVFVSPPVDGAATTYTLPAGVLDVGSTYTAKIVATTPERIPSYPSWIVRSPSFNL
ncbi:MAG: hypothetical protein EOP07_08300 [Proteobacteria bacterium]|nr:MAG: hypothetical protein EOP07_08300 [Pseudomonadota bacterium]